ncbi:DUF6884 domain-containing protein [Deinococcus sp. ME38]|uniref:DUF6884 domain-containing protein n=1 Tax=Deinococcus sp. ME38 TaxID=3400344 RepID=UPI003B5B0092
MRTLVVVPCGAKKIWADRPSLGAVRAAEAYVGVPFRVNRAYAEVVGDAWVILSAKYGFLAPDDLLEGPYEVTFKRKKTNPVAVETLRRQVIERDLASFDRVIGLGGVEYRAALAEAFGDHAEVMFPFAGLALGYSLQATKAVTLAAAPTLVK